MKKNQPFALPYSQTYSMKVIILSAISILCLEAMICGQSNIDANSFAPKVVFTTNSAAQFFAVEDFNGDGKPDIA